MSAQEREALAEFLHRRVFNFTGDSLDQADPGIWADALGLADELIAADLLPVPVADADAIERAAEVVADKIWQIHGPESTDRDSAEMDAEDVVAALAAAGLLASPVREPDTVAKAWDLSPDEVATLLPAAIEAVAWQLLELTMDTSDRAPSQDMVEQARADARRFFAVPVREPGRSEAEIKAEALREFKADILPEWSEAMGGSASWLTTADRVAARIGEWIDDVADQIAPAAQVSDTEGGE